MLNTAAEGMILAGLAWALLRLIGRQSSRTRFAVWFGALLTIVALPFFARLGAGAPLPMMADAKVHQEIILSAAWANYLFAAWAVGATFLLLRLSVGLWQVHACGAVAGRWNSERLEPAIAAGPSRFRVPLANASSAFPSEVTGPAAIGFFRPAIVFPAWLLPQLSAMRSK